MSQHSFAAAAAPSAVAAAAAKPADIYAGGSKYCSFGRTFFRVKEITCVHIYISV